MMNQIRSICSDAYQKAVRVERQICLNYGLPVAIALVVIPIFLSMGPDAIDSFKRPDYRPDVEEHALMAIKTVSKLFFFGCASLAYMDRHKRLQQQRRTQLFQAARAA